MSFWYNGYNQLSRIQDPDGNFADYTYNAQGLRSRKEYKDKVTNYFYDRGSIVLETDAENMVSAKTIRGLGLIYRQSETDQATYYYLHNAHGDVTKLLNATGEIVKDYEYDPFGREQAGPIKAFGGDVSKDLWQSEIETIDNPFRYSGEYRDEETGNYYLRARYYDPESRRFTSEDYPWKGVAQVPGLVSGSLYAFCGNNPVNYVDPSGHIGLSLVNSASATIVKAAAQALESFKATKSSTTAKSSNTTVTPSNTPAAKKAVAKVARLAKSTYNWVRAVSYARAYAEEPNPVKPFFSGHDCANFVSQCLMYAGIKPTSESNYKKVSKIKLGNIWKDGESVIDWDGFKATTAWATADGLFHFISKPKYSEGTVPITYTKNQEQNQKLLGEQVSKGMIRPGDLAFWDFDDDGKQDHATIVVDVNYITGQVFYAGHSNPQSHADMAVKMAQADPEGVVTFVRMRR